jgi:hypothetical protein
VSTSTRTRFTRDASRRIAVACTKDVRELGVVFVVREPDAFVKGHQYRSGGDPESGVIVIAGFGFFDLLDKAPQSEVRHRIKRFIAKLVAVILVLRLLGLRIVDVVRKLLQADNLCRLPFESTPDEFLVTL